MLSRIRKVIVTGGTAGIGFAVASEMLDRGHNVYICARCETGLNSVISSLIEKFGADRVNGSICDVRNLSSVQIMVSLAADFLGGIDTLINNAGIAFIAPFEDITENQWRDIVDTNLNGVFNCCHAALTWLKKANGADIINLGSRSGRYASAGGTAYSATKLGLQGFSEALFLDLHKYGIRVTLVAPGAVSTGLGGKSKEEWHLLPKDVAVVIGDVLALDYRANINWVEIRPSRPE